LRLICMCPRIFSVAVFFCFFFLFNCLPYLVNKDEYTSITHKRKDLLEAYSVVSITDI